MASWAAPRHDDASVQPHMQQPHDGTPRLSAPSAHAPSTERWYTNIESSQTGSGIAAQGTMPAHLRTVADWADNVAQAPIAREARSSASQLPPIVPPARISSRNSSSINTAHVAERRSSTPSTVRSEMGGTIVLLPPNSARSPRRSPEDVGLSGPVIGGGDAMHRDGIVARTPSPRSARETRLVAHATSTLRRALDERYAALSPTSARAKFAELMTEKASSGQKDGAAVAALPGQAEDVVELDATALAALRTDEDVGAEMTQLLSHSKALSASPDAGDLQGSNPGSSSARRSKGDAAHSVGFVVVRQEPNIAALPVASARTGAIVSLPPAAATASLTPDHPAGLLSDDAMMHVPVEGGLLAVEQDAGRVSGTGDSADLAAARTRRQQQRMSLVGMRPAALQPWSGPAPHREQSSYMAKPTVPTGWLHHGLQLLGLRGADLNAHGVNLPRGPAPEEGLRPLMPLSPDAGTAESARGRRQSLQGSEASDSASLRELSPHARVAIGGFARRGRRGSASKSDNAGTAKRRWSSVRIGVSLASAATQDKYGRVRVNKGCIIDPRSSFVRFWDSIMLLLLTYVALVTPFEVAFLSSRMDIDGLFVANRIVDVLFLFDMILQFFVAIVRPDGIITDRNILARKYLQSWAVVDFISILPFDTLGLVFADATLRQLQVIRILRLLKLAKMFRIIGAARIAQRWEAYLSLSRSMVNLVKSIVGVLCVVHWFACVYRLVPSLEQSEHNWITAYAPFQLGPGDSADSVEPVRAWLTAVTWAVQTIVTVGYGDVPAQTDGERIVTVMCMLVGGFIFAYIVGNICSIVSNLDSINNEFYQQLDALNQYMRENNLPDELRVRLRQYFYFARQLHRIKYYRDLLAHMSPMLRGEVAVYINSVWVLKVPFFVTADIEETKSFITDVAMVMQPEAYAPRELIIKNGEAAQKMFIVQRGMVSRLGRVFSTGAVLGQDMILCLTLSGSGARAGVRPASGMRNYSVRALTYVMTTCLTRDALEALLEREQYAEMRRSIRRASIRMALLREFVHVAKLLRVMRQVVPGFCIQSPAHLSLLHNIIGRNYDALRRRRPLKLPRRATVVHTPVIITTANSASARTGPDLAPLESASVSQRESAPHIAAAGAKLAEAAVLADSLPGQVAAEPLPTTLNECGPAPEQTLCPLNDPGANPRESADALTPAAASAVPTAGAPSPLGVTDTAQGEAPAAPPSESFASRPPKRIQYMPQDLETTIALQQAMSSTAVSKQRRLSTFVGGINIRGELNDATRISLDPETRRQLADAIAAAVANLPVGMVSTSTVQQPGPSMAYADLTGRLGDPPGAENTGRDVSIAHGPASASARPPHSSRPLSASPSAQTVDHAAPQPHELFGLLPVLHQIHMDAAAIRSHALRLDASQPTQMQHHGARGGGHANATSARAQLQLPIHGVSEVSNDVTTHPGPERPHAVADGRPAVTARSVAPSARAAETSASNAMLTAAQADRFPAVDPAVGQGPGAASKYAASDHVAGGAIAIADKTAAHAPMPAAIPAMNRRGSRLGISNRRMSGTQNSLVGASQAAAGLGDTTSNVLAETRQLLKWVTNVSIGIAILSAVQFIMIAVLLSQRSSQSQ